MCVKCNPFNNFSQCAFHRRMLTPSSKATSSSMMMMMMMTLMMMMVQFFFFIFLQCKGNRCLLCFSFIGLKIRFSGKTQSLLQKTVDITNSLQKTNQPISYLLSIVQITLFILFTSLFHKQMITWNKNQMMSFFKITKI